jgi:hypothetical protein
MVPCNAGQNGVFVQVDPASHLQFCVFFVEMFLDSGIKDCGCVRMHAMILEFIEPLSYTFGLVVLACHLGFIIFPMAIFIPYIP